MRVDHCIFVTISQLTRFGPWKRVGLMTHPSGLSLITIYTGTNYGSLWISTYGLTASECETGYYYGQGSGKGQRRIQSY